MHIVIIGNGISGVTAARYIRKMSDHSITIISSETQFFYSRTALMYIYMGHMQFEHTKPYEDHFWEKNKIDLVLGKVTSVDYQSKTLEIESKGNLEYDKLIIATGSKPNMFDWPGKDLKGVQGLYHIQDVEKLESMTPRIKRGVVVGGGLIGIELAEMLHSRDIPVTFLVREKAFWNHVLPDEEAEMINKHIKANHIDLRLSSELDEIIGDDEGRVKGIKTKTGEVIDCEFVGITVGVRPNIDFLRTSELEIDRGIVVNEQLETNIPDVYAIGDCAQQKNPVKGRRPLEQVWYTGKMMGEVLAHNICKATPLNYNPGIWFNSAKFIDIEYQTYGTVMAQNVEGEESFVWENQGKNLLFRMNFDKATKSVTGINVFGMRLRHDVCDSWIKNHKTIDFALEHLKDALFDPEFYKQHEKDIVSAYNQKYKANISLKKKSWKRILTALQK